MQIQSQKQFLAEKHKTLFELDAQIENHTEDERKRGSPNDAVKLQMVEENGSSIRTNEQTFIDMDYANFASCPQRSAHKVNGTDPKTTGQNISTRARNNRNNRHLETLVEVEEEASDGRAISTSRTEKQSRVPVHPATSPFEPEVAKEQWKRTSSAVSSSGQKPFTEDAALSLKMLHSGVNPAQRVEPEGIESPPLELFDLDSVWSENKHRRKAQSVVNVSPFKAKKSFDRSVGVVNNKNDADQRREPFVQSVQPELEYSPLHLDTSGGHSRYYKPSDGSSGSEHSSPSSLSSLSSASSHSSSTKAPIFAVTGVVKNTPKEKRLDAVHQEGSGSDSYQGGQLRLSKPKDFQSFKQEHSKGGKNDVRHLTSRQVKTEASPTRYESVGPLVRTARLDFSASGNNPPALPERGHHANRPLPRDVRAAAVDSPQEERNETPDASFSNANSQECTPGTLSSPAIADGKASIRNRKSPSPSSNDTKKNALLAENRYRETDATKILAEVDRFETAPMLSSSISVRGQSSVTKITVTPSPTFPPNKAKIPEKRSPVPTSKRTRLMNREVPPASDCSFDSVNVRKQESSERETLHSGRADGVTPHPLLHEQQSSRPRSLESGKKASREGDKHVVSSVSIQLARKPLENMQRTSASLEENDDFYFPTERTRTESKITAGQGKLSREEKCTEEERAPARDDELPGGRSLLQQASIVSRSAKSATERGTLHVGSMSSSGDSRNGNNSTKPAEDWAVPSFKEGEHKFLFEEDDRVPAREFPVVIYEATVKNKEAAASALNAVSSFEGKGGNVTSSLKTEVKNLPTVAVESLRSTGQRSPVVSVGKMAPSSVEADTTKTSPLHDVGPFEQASNGSTSPAKQNQISPNDKITPKVKSTAADESAKTNQARAQQKDEDKTKKARHVSLDPHAVLLDAAVEGELDLVKYVIQEVRHFSPQVA